jgi:hypothetical protein
MAQLGIQQLLNAEQEAQQIVQQARDGEYFLRPYPTLPPSPTTISLSTSNVLAFHTFVGLVDLSTLILSRVATICVVFVDSCAMVVLMY